MNHIVIAQILHTGNGAATLQLRAVAHSRFSRSKAQSPWIDNGGSRSQQRTTYQQLFLKHNLAFHVEMEAGTMDQVLAMVQSNLGVGFYPESMAASALAAGTVFQIRLAEPIPERFVNLIEDTSRPQSVAMKAFKKMLLAPEEE